MNLFIKINYTVGQISLKPVIEKPVNDL